MNNDVLPPKTPTPEPVDTPLPVEVVPEPGAKQPGLKASTDDKAWFKKRRFLLPVTASIGLILAAALSAVIWYVWALSPVDSSNTRHNRVEIVAGSSPSDIAETLHGHNLIRSTLAFDIYTRLTGVKSSLQAGVYSISPSESTEQIVAKLSSGDVTDEQVDITFYPGATLVDNVTTDKSKRLDVRTVLMRAGYSEAEITAAFNADYNSPLLDGKPKGTDIEGYVYGETYKFDKNATVKQILERTFDEFYQVVLDNNLIEKFKSHGLSLYQGITLASIVQREAHNADDQKQVAQVFLTRLSIGMQLGSDVTYQYIADKIGVPRDTNLDSPYNTRRYVGLPPGPISTPGLSALQAVAEPAPGDYLYFLAGDDGKVYFAHTNAQHEANIQQHCQKGCQEL